MRFLADENFPGEATRALRAFGNDVIGIGDDAPGSSDVQVLARAAREQRVLLTFDKDFGELAKASPLLAGCGVILFRIPMSRPESVGQQLAGLIMARDDWAGHFSVIEPGRVRMRRLGK